MNKMKSVFAVIIALIVVIASYIAYGIYNPNQVAKKSDEIEVFLTRTCGCCKKWVSHLNENGLKTKLTYLDDLREVKSKNKVPAQLGSCHTAVVNGYVVEGHVPADSVKKLISQKPNIKGIAVPGMPMGSPGMEGAYTERYNVVSFDHEQNLGIFDTYN